jgi:hypothetical protein
MSAGSGFPNRRRQTQFVYSLIVCLVAVVSTIPSHVWLARFDYVNEAGDNDADNNEGRQYDMDGPYLAADTSRTYKAASRTAQSRVLLNVRC